MNKIFFLFMRLAVIILLIFPFLHGDVPGSPNLVGAMTIDATRVQAVDVLFVLIAPNDQLREIAALLKQDLEFTKQLSLKIIERPKPMSASELQKMAEQYTFVLFLTGNGAADSFNLEWRLYDTDQAMMIDGKRSSYQQGTLQEWIDHVADQLWQALMGSAGFFSTKIAYCKQVEKKSGRCTKICTRNAADFKGVTERVLVDNSKIHIALRWNRDVQHPLLLYSECTPRNVRLCVVTAQGQRRTVCNFDGINMQASYAPDEKFVVVCLVRNGNSDLYKFHFDEQQHKGIYEQLNPGDGSYFDPWWADNNRIYFSSDVLHDHEPSIGYLDPDSKNVTWITTQGFCTTPVYCGKNKLLAYLKKIDGLMQIMLYDERTNKHTQLTKDNSSKSTCSWSGCGNYLVVAVEDEKGRRIALCNAQSGHLYSLTGNDQICYHPAWQGV